MVAASQYAMSPYRPAGLATSPQCSRYLPAILRTQLIDQQVERFVATHRGEIADDEDVRMPGHGEIGLHRHAAGAKDFLPVTVLNKTNNVLSVPPNSPFKSLAELVRYAMRNGLISPDA